ncbi:MAG TPA: hypothetical protein VF948_11040 [Methylomirabilota bacterium]
MTRLGRCLLFVCIVLRQVVLAARQGAVSEIVAEGLLIVGWVAMWRPLEIFLYEWWPIHRRCRVFELRPGAASRVCSLP